MRSAVTALAWEIWRRGRVMAWLVIGTIATCALANVFTRGEAEVRENLEPFQWLALVISLALVFAIFHQAEFNARKNWHGFPYRLFALPVPTWLLVAVPMILGVVTLELVCMAWAELVFAPLGRSFSPWVAFVLGVGLLSYQAIVWSLAGFRFTRMLALTVAGIVFANAGSMLLFIEYTSWPWRKAFEIMGLAMAVLAVAAFVGAWYSVEKQRRGGGRGRGWLRAMAARIADAMPRRKKGFNSPASAQFWFEWRRSGLALPAVVGIALLLVFAPYSWFARNDHDSASLTLAWALGLPVILAGVIGKGFGALGFSPGDRGLPAFLAVRPVSSGEMVVAKMKVAALSVIISWLLVLGFLGLWLPLWANAKDMRQPWDTLVIWWGVYGTSARLVLLAAALAILTWGFMVSSLWLALSGSIKRCAIAVIVGLIGLGLMIAVVLQWVRHFDWDLLEQYVAWLGWGLGAAVVLKLWLAVFSWRNIRPGRVWRYVLLWVGATGCFVGLGMLVCPNVFWLKHLVILAALLPVPLARLGFAPRALEANRHR